MLNNGGIRVLAETPIFWYLFDSVMKKQCWMWSESSPYRTISVILIGTGCDGGLLYCFYSCWVLFFFFLQQRKLVPSRISLVTMATASQPGGNVMAKKNVLMGQTNPKQHAVSNRENWYFSNVLSYQSVEKLEMVFPTLAGWSVNFCFC